MEVKIHKNDQNKTIWQNFEMNIKDQNNTQEIIGALSVVNAKLIGLSRDASLIEENMIQIVEFGDNFNKKYAKKTKKARYKNWGQEAFALRLYEDIKENCQYEIHVLKGLEKANTKELQKARTLGNTICKIKGDKKVTICYPDGSLTLDFPKYMKNINQNQLLTAITNDTLKNNCGVIICRPNFDGTENIYGLRTSNYNVEVIGLEELKWSYSVDSRTGEKIPVPKQLRFKEFKISL